MRVLVVDDQGEVLELVQRALIKDAHDVSVAGSISEARDSFEARPTEIVVLDLGLPDGSGEELCRWLRARSEQLAILVLTAENAVASKVRCLDAGADDYLSKPFAVAELRARIRALARRAAIAVPVNFERGRVELDFGVRRATCEGKEAPITAKEWAILEVLVASAGRIVPRAELLDRVWRRNDEASAATLEVLVGRIRRKLGTDLIRTARGEGYVVDHG